MYTGKLNVEFIYQTTYSWHSFLKWKYEEGYLINLALNLALTHDSTTLGLAEKSSDPQPVVRTVCVQCDQIVGAARYLEDIIVALNQYHPCSLKVESTQQKVTTWN